MSGVRVLAPDELRAFRLARLVSAEQMPYFMRALFAAQPVAAPGLGTFAVDAQWRLYLDPALLVGAGAWPVPVAGAVLLRAARVIDGCGAAQGRRRAGVTPAAIARGPGNLCEALGITLADNGIDLMDRRSPVRLELHALQEGSAGPRVGVSQAADRPWRFWLADTPEVSAYRRSPRAAAPGDSD